MAEFCVALRITPAEFRSLTLLEYAELAKAFSNSRGSDLEDF
jgi:hypothetical protein